MENKSSEIESNKSKPEKVVPSPGMTSRTVASRYAQSAKDYSINKRSKSSDRSNVSKGRVTPASSPLKAVTSTPFGLSPLGSGASRTLNFSGASAIAGQTGNKKPTTVTIKDKLMEQGKQQRGRPTLKSMRSDSDLMAKGPFKVTSATDVRSDRMSNEMCSNVLMAHRLQAMYLERSMAELMQKRKEEASKQITCVWQENNKLADELHQLEMKNDEVKMLIKAHASVKEQKRFLTEYLAMKSEIKVHSDQISNEIEQKASQLVLNGFRVNSEKQFNDQTEKTANLVSACQTKADLASQISLQVHELGELKKSSDDMASNLVGKLDEIEELMSTKRHYEKMKESLTQTK